MFYLKALWFFVYQLIDIIRQFLFCNHAALIVCSLNPIET